MQDLSSPTRDRTCAPCSGSAVLTNGPPGKSRGATFFSFKLILFYLFLILAVLGLCCCAWAFSSCGERGLLFAAVRGLLIAVASLVAEYRL